MLSRIYFVYILSNRSGTLYIGITNNLFRRLKEHESGLIRGFSAKFKLDRLIYFECFGEAELAIAREKELKGWIREKKIKLVRKSNPKFEDLSRLIGPVQTIGIK